MTIINYEFFLSCQYRKPFNGYTFFHTTIIARNKPDAIKKAKEKFGEDIIVKYIEKRE